MATIDNSLGNNETALFFWLLNSNNRLGWVGWFEVSSAKTCEALRFTSRSTLTRCRRRLKDAGLIDFLIDKRTKRVRYSLQTCDRNGSRPATEGATPNKTYIQTEREGTHSLNFKDLIACAEAKFSKRSDIIACANAAQVYYTDKGQKLTQSRLNAWIAGEKHPQYKAQNKPTAPSDWRDIYANRYGITAPDYSWNVFAQNYPIEAKEIIKIAQGCDRKRYRPATEGATEKGTENDSKT